MGGHALPGMDDPALLLNVLEMWMCLVFRSLPASVLEEWTPEGVDAMRKRGKEGVFGGLNIRSPLDQGGSKASFVDLSECDDPLVREYVGVGTANSHGKIKVEDEVELRKKMYAEKARRLNQGQRGVNVSTNTLIVFGMGVVLGFALAKGFSGPIQRRWCYS